jgi:hypothetical protein
VDGGEPGTLGWALTTRIARPRYLERLAESGKLRHPEPKWAQ